MDNKGKSTDPIVGDQELAKVLAGVNGGGNAVGITPSDDSTTNPGDSSNSGAKGRSDKTNIDVSQSADDSDVKPDDSNKEAGSTPDLTDLEGFPDFSSPDFSNPANSGAGNSTPAASGDLESVKKDAIVALKPLVGKLNLSGEEKFNTYLLLIRSTDDKALIAPAYEAAKSIEDETKRAEALLNVIKEIDYLSGGKAAK